MERQLIDSYKSAQAVARRRAHNFYYSFAVLPPEKRSAFCAVYAFMRYCDDISDGDFSVETKRAALQRWRAQLNAVFSDSLLVDPILPAFRDTVRRYSIPAQYFHWIINGAEMDLDVSRYETFDELYTYCFHVAAAVGLVCLQIFGFGEERAKKLAEYCGIAFQLTNILRDIKEDLRMGRIYLPLEDLKRFGYTAEELRLGVINNRFRGLMKFEVDRARRYYDAARALIPLIDPASRPTLWAMMVIYERILDRIVERGYDVFSAPIRLSRCEKISIMLQALSRRILQKWAHVED